MTETTFAEERLTDVQREGAENGNCPHCGNGMAILNAVPAKTEHYCHACHFSFPMFKR